MISYIRRLLWAWRKTRSRSEPIGLPDPYEPQTPG